MPVTLNLEHTDLTQATPPEIDADLFALMQADYANRDETQAVILRMHQKLDHRSSSTWAWRLTDPEVILKAQDGAPELYEQLRDLERQTVELAAREVPYQTEFNRRGGWTRAYLVDNVDGHLHKNTYCSTCRPSTRFHWVTEVSGLTEREIVKRAGEKACTVCYTSAPVDVLKRPSQFEGPNMRVARESAERRVREKIVRDAEKAKKAIANPNGTPLRIGSYYGVIKTERAAWTHLVGLVFNHMAYDYDAHIDEQERIVAALAAKTGLTRQEVLDQVEAKVRVKARREGVQI